MAAAATLLFAAPSYGATTCTTADYQLSVYIEHGEIKDPTWIGPQQQEVRVDGSFILKKQNPDHISIKLTTNYEPLMTPRWMWRPLEKLTAQALHNHVIDQIAKKALRAESQRLSRIEKSEGN